MKRKDWSQGRDKCDSEGYCRVCGGQNPQAAHIVPRSLGGGMESLDFVPLCQGCHSAFDTHVLDLLPYTTKEEQGRAVTLVGMENARIRLCPSEYKRSAA